LIIFTFLKKGVSIAGKKFAIEQYHEGQTPHVHMIWTPPGKNSSRTLIFMTDYAMYLEFGKARGGYIDGKVYISLPDYLKSFVVGQFKAKYQQ
jgi:hypothetical protein